MPIYRVFVRVGFEGETDEIPFEMDVASVDEAKRLALANVIHAFVLPQGSVKTSAHRSVYSGSVFHLEGYRVFVSVVSREGAEFKSDETVSFKEMLDRAIDAVDVSPKRGKVKVYSIQPDRIVALNVSNTLKEFQRLVGGYIELGVKLPSGDVLVVNEEGRRLGKEPFFRVVGDPHSFLGTAFVVGQRGDKFVDVKTPLREIYRTIVMLQPFEYDHRFQVFQKASLFPMRERVLVMQMLSEGKNPIEVLSRTRR